MSGLELYRLQLFQPRPGRGQAARVADELPGGSQHGHVAVDTATSGLESLSTEGPLPLSPAGVAQGGWIGRQDRPAGHRPLARQF